MKKRFIVALIMVLSALVIFILINFSLDKGDAKYSESNDTRKVTQKTDESKINDEDIITAHIYSSGHRNELEKDKLCGCFYCCKVFNPNEIKDWIKDKNGDTAICPYCGIDSIIGESSGYPITKEFLKKMYDYWF